ncbi:MerR family transcriptional regulator [Streptomyces sp. NPDC006798]|uniref:MerR family transcriptional regulator n=1 Tax=Streptomyces sp. NPDC006798 TaxID=3155462 RepID=UPI0034089B4E
MTLFTTAEAAALATTWRQQLTAGAAAVTPAAVRQWAARGHLPRGGLDPRGRPLYRIGDLARAEAATRPGALRLVGIGPGPAPHPPPAPHTPHTGSQTRHSTPASPARPGGAPAR